VSSDRRWLGPGARKRAVKSRRCPVSLDSKLPSEHTVMALLFKVPEGEV
jgi:hypothetical protein